MQHPPPRIRTATPGDLPALVALERAAFGADAAPAWCLRQWIDIGGPLCMLATADDAAAVGALDVQGAAYAAIAADAVGANERSAWILSVAVDPAMRGRGIADALLAAVEAELLRRGVSQALATVAPNNAASRRLFARRGYAEEALHRDYFGAGEDRIQLCRRLQD